MAHDFKNFPELTNEQMELYYFQSPHKQIMEDFIAEVVNVHDGDTISVKTNFRDFVFPIRLAEINAPELNEVGGKESGDWLRSRIDGRTIKIEIDPENRVGKFGRLIGKIIFQGVNINEESINFGYSKPFERRKEGKIPTFTEWLLTSD